MGSSPPEEFHQPPIQQPVVIDPEQSTIVKIVLKETEVPFRLTKQQETIIKQLTQTTIQQFKLRLVAKFAKRQIRINFNKQNTNSSDKELEIKSNSSNFAPARLQSETKNDVEIYLAILEIRLKCIVRDRLKQQDEYLLQQQVFTKLKIKLQSLFRQQITFLMGQIQGKTSIWHSLNLSYSQKLTKITNFLHEQGVDSSKFSFLKSS